LGQGKKKSPNKLVSNKCIRGLHWAHGRKASLLRQQKDDKGKQNCGSETIGSSADEIHFLKKYQKKKWKRPAAEVLAAEDRMYKEKSSYNFFFWGAKVDPGRVEKIGALSGL